MLLVFSETLTAALQGCWVHHVKWAQHTVSHGQQTKTLSPICQGRASEWWMTVAAETEILARKL